MTSTPIERAAAWRLAVCAAALTLAAGCATQTSQPTAAPATTSLPAGNAALARVVADATQALLAQAPKGLFESLWVRWQPRPVVIEPVYDRSSWQRTAATYEVERAIGKQVAQGEGYALLPFRAASLARKPLVISGALTPKEAADAGQPQQALTLRLFDMDSGKTLARQVTKLGSAVLDATPSAFDRDSPVTTIAVATPTSASAAPHTSAAAASTSAAAGDRVTVGAAGAVITASATRDRAAEADETGAAAVQRLHAVALLGEADAAYEQGRFEEAAAAYRRAAAAPGADTLRVHIGLYLSAAKLGRAAESQEAFGQVVAVGLQRRSLGLKLLFRPGSTEFWADPAVSAPYASWLEEIARQTARVRACMNVVGHSSRTGSAEFNEQLSLQRAQMIRQRMESVDAALVPRLRSQGMGFRENLVGSGSDDLRDAADRRVEFRIVDCVS